MTATRVIDDHLELTNVGTTTHAQIDNYINNSQFVLVSSSSVVPPSARKLIAGVGVSIVDTGPGGSVIISCTVTGSSGGGSSNNLFSFNEIPVGDIDGSNEAFSLANAPFPSTSLLLFLNGVKQTEGISSDYVLIGSAVSFNYTPRSGSNIDATYTYAGATTPTTFSFNEVPTGDIDGANATFIFQHVPNPTNSFMLFLNGVKQREGLDSDFTLTGQIVNFNYVPRVGSNIDATYQY